MTRKSKDRDVIEAQTSIKEALGMIVGDGGHPAEGVPGKVKGEGGQARDPAKHPQRTPAAK